MLRILLVGLALLPGCPVFTEFLSDPLASGDALGEYLEISWKAESAFWDTLIIQQEDALPLLWKRDSATNRLLAHRNAPVACPLWKNVACIPLTGPALPNSRSARWTLQAGFCRDTADLLAPRPGIAQQRTGISPGDWAFSSIPSPPEKAGTPGQPDPQYENDIDDCVSWVKSAHWNGKAWSIELDSRGCAERSVQVEARFTNAAPPMNWELASGSGELPPIQRGSAIWLRRIHPPDANPANDTLDTLLLVPQESPLRITEVAPCPEEPLPEWFEITNISDRSFPLGELRECSSGLLSTPLDSLPAGASLIATRDTSTLRDWFGFPEARLALSSVPSMRNSADTLALCWKQLVLDSTIWGSNNSPPCPESYSPQTPQQLASPGFKSVSSSPSTDSPLEINVRILSLSDIHASLQARWTSMASGYLRLVNRSNTVVATLHVPAAPGTSAWTPIVPWRQCGPGPCFLHFVSEDHHEKILGFVVRP